MKALFALLLLLYITTGCEPFTLERKNFADCKTPSATIDATISRLQVNVALTNANQEFRNIEWDFGDGRSLPQYGIKAAYLYERPGTYTVRARLTTVCSQTAAPARTIRVTE